MSVPLPSPFACPQCQQADQVQKISAVIGRSTLPEQTPEMPNTSSSLLSQRLAPPEEPPYSGLLTPGEVIATIVMAVIALPAFGLAFEAFRETRSLMAQAVNDPF